MKKCTKCNQEKSLVEFNKHKLTKDGLQSTCKTCIKEKSTQWAKNNPIRTKQALNKYLTKKQGIYEWYEGDISLYIGQSSRLNSRIASHKCWFKNPLIAPITNQPLYYSLQQHPNASIRIIEECSREVLLEREQHYINAKKPLYNKYVIVT